MTTESKFEVRDKVYCVNSKLEDDGVYSMITNGQITSIQGDYIFLGEGIDKIIFHKNYVFPSREEALRKRDEATEVTMKLSRIRKKIIKNRE